jgi:hypothetical protein
VEKHAMALGYFFLAAFCLFASGQPTVPFRSPLLLAGRAAALVGAVFFVSACAPRILAINRAIANWFVETARLVSRKTIRLKLPNCSDQERDGITFMDGIHEN